MGWNEILAWVIPIVVSCIITTVIGFLIKHYLTKYFNKVEAERKAKIEAEKAEQEELLGFRKQEEDRQFAELLANAIKEANKPLCEKVDNIDTKLEQDRKATITVLRSKMKTLRDQYKKQGYADAGDKATWEELYKDYAEMGGNFFKEYVDQWREEVRSLPYEAPVEMESVKLPYTGNNVHHLAVAAKRPAPKVKKDKDLVDIDNK